MSDDVLSDLLAFEGLQKAQEAIFKFHKSLEALKNCILLIYYDCEHIFIDLAAIWVSLQASKGVQAGLISAVGVTNGSRGAQAAVQTTRCIIELQYLVSSTLVDNFTAI